MQLFIRTALLLCGALSATSIAPAQTGPSSEPLLPVESASLPQVAVPQLLDPQADVELTQPSEITPDTQSSAAEGKEVTVSGDLASMVAQLRSSDPGSRELECLAVGIYFEAKSEPLVGQVAVGEVIANRANSKGRFPGSYCGVLFQRSQFSFIRGRALPSVPRTSKQWRTAVAVAKIVDRDLHDSAADNALFFHAKRVSPRWKLKRVASIGNHVFYR